MEKMFPIIGKTAGGGQGAGWVPCPQRASGEWVVMEEACIR